MLHKTRWTPEKIAQRLTLIEPLVYRNCHPLPPFYYQTLADPADAPPVSPEINHNNWPVIEPNTYWGRWRTNYILRTHFQIPGTWDHETPLALTLPLGEAGDFSHPEMLAYIDGVSFAACDRHHQEILLPSQCHDGQAHLLALHGWTGLGGRSDNRQGTQLFMQPCAVVQIDRPTRNFVATARVALGIANNLEPHAPARGQLLNALDKAFKILDTREPFGDNFYNSLPAAHVALQAGIKKAGPALDVDIIASGHAHIDVAWLWTLGQARRKAGRTFHTVVRLMEQFPNYHFTQSQPQLYDYIRQDHPDLFETIKQRAAEGRWEPIGGMWVEADCNLSGAESLARQFLLGRTFFRQHFGPDAESPVLWLPDVFGYAWALPQLIKQAGLDYFFTIKIGWNQYNRLPYDSFWWQGLDGTRVLTHFSTTPDPGGRFASTYNALATPQEALGTWTNFQQKELQNELLMVFGHGDGGGGPTREMLENIREMANFPATPRLRHGKAGDFFRRLEAASGESLPTWNGELYLELHRGTYTTQSRNKRANRKSEFLLHDAEFLAVLAGRLDTEYVYPHEALHKAWQLVCLNQFHDIIPGSSIGEVYVESLQQYAEITHLASAVRDDALKCIAGQIGGNLLIVNPTSFTQSDLAFWPGQLGRREGIQFSNGRAIPTQTTENGTWLALDHLPPFSVTSLQICAEESPPPATGLQVTPGLLENAFVRVELNEAGDITRFFDKVRQRELLPEGGLANQFQAFEDRPINWNAWDIDIFFDDKMWPANPATSVKVVETGPLRATLEVRRQILHSTYVQQISLAYHSSRLDFATTIDWQERYILLKVAFPVDILSPQATYEIQWGNVERPTHHNTIWDWARFETCAQKWVDLSEGDYGVSLLNDCKYGHDIRDNIIRLTLLRSSTNPDPEADRGEHRFAYSLLPHPGKWDETTVAAAYLFNDPLLVVGGQNDEKAALPASTPSMALISVDQPHIVIETIKQAEDGEGIIVRLYESQRRRGPVTLTVGFDLAAAWQTNLLEENQESLPVKDNSLTLFVRPYQIITLRLVSR